MYTDSFGNKASDHPEVSEYDKNIAKINRLQKERLFRHALRGIIEDKNVIDTILKYEIKYSQKITFQDIVGDDPTDVHVNTANELLQIYRDYFNNCKPDIIIVQHRSTGEYDSFWTRENPTETELFDLIVDRYIDGKGTRIIWITGETSYSINFGTEIFQMFGFLIQKLNNEFLTGGS